MKDPTESNPPKTRPVFRTRRRGPRIVALIVTLGWLLVYQQGTAALALKAQESVTAFDTLIKDDLLLYGLTYASDPNQCLGVLQTVLKQDSSRTLTMKGTFAISPERTNRDIEISFRASLSEHLLVQGISSNIRVGDTLIAFRSDEDDPYKMFAELTATDLQRSLEFVRPSPVFLAKQPSGYYAFEFPQSLKLLAELGEAKLADSERPLALLPFSKEQATACLSRFTTDSNNVPLSTDAIESALLEATRATAEASPGVSEHNENNPDKQDLPHGND